MSSLMTQHAFNKAATTYDQYCYLQNKVGKRLCELVGEQHLETNHILDLGCGTGQTTEVLAKKQPYHHFTAVDFAPRLLNIATDRLSPHKIQTVQADFLNLPTFNEPADLVFSNLALHWSASFEDVLTSINRAIKDKGTLAVSIPLLGTLREIKPFFTINRFFSSAQVLRFLQNAGYSLMSMHTETITLKFHSTMAALQSLKLVGANNTNQKPLGGLSGRSLLSKIAIHTLTYEIGYFITKRDDACQLNTLLPEQTPASAKQPSPPSC